MRILLQRVNSARVSVDGRETGRIGSGALVFVGVARDDGRADVEYMVGKILDLRIFEDDAGKMNRSLSEVGGEALVVPQFTLYGDCRRGRRPSFDIAAPSEVAGPVYDDLVDGLRARGVTVATGEFQARMKVELVNDGPVTLLLESLPSDRRGAGL